MGLVSTTSLLSTYHSTIQRHGRIYCLVWQYLPSLWIYLSWTRRMFASGEQFLDSTSLGLAPVAKKKKKKYIR